MNIGYRRAVLSFARVAIPVVFVVPFHSKAQRQFSFMHENFTEREPHVLIHEETEEEVAYWDDKRKECSLCARCLDSPCSKQFKSMCRCIDKADEGFLLSIFIAYFSYPLSSCFVS